VNHHPTNIHSWEFVMFAAGWLSALDRRFHLTNRARPRGRRADRRLPFAGEVSLLEDRCLLSSSGPIPLPANTVGSVDQVLYNGVSGTYAKTFKITNNSPTQTIYAFLEGSITRQASSPYDGTSAFDPFDASSQEYRGYVGYTVGTNDYAGLPPLTSITVTVPLAFWDSGRILFSTDGADQFATFGGPTGGSPPDAPFNYQNTNTQATYYASVDSVNPSQLDFTPIYNSFDPRNGGKPTTNNWQSPIARACCKMASPMS
jgi:hypothetical protein